MAGGNQAHRPGSSRGASPGKSATSGASTANTGAAAKTGGKSPREMTPIIGNDGRIIDPSEHLPTDTWAPEPERRTAKPSSYAHNARFAQPTAAAATYSAGGSRPSTSQGLPSSAPSPAPTASYAGRPVSRGGDDRLARPVSRQSYDSRMAAPPQQVYGRTTPSPAPSPTRRLSPLPSPAPSPLSLRYQSQQQQQQQQPQHPRGYSRSPQPLYSAQPATSPSPYDIAPPSPRYEATRVNAPMFAPTPRAPINASFYAPAGPPIPTSVPIEASGSGFADDDRDIFNDGGGDDAMLRRGMRGAQGAVGRSAGWY
ncbi:hypothetical protein KEM52_004201 [Ascosphaera acerosa]|nr:hypothetical protein KEM52_004201 [Ascosphaera acerosa]